MKTKIRMKARGVKIKQDDACSIAGCNAPPHILRFAKMLFGISAAITLMSAITQSTHATVLADHTIKPYVSLGTSYDSNLLRRDIVPVTNKKGEVIKYIKNPDSKGSFVTQIAAGFDMDWKLSRQHFIIKANVNENIFENFSTLNYLGWDTLAQWNWQLGNDFSGELGYSNKHTLAGFGQVNSLIPNLVDIEKYFVNGGYFFHPDWQLRAGFSRNNWSYDGTSRATSNNMEDTGEFGIQYLNPKRNMAGLRASITDGSYPDRPTPDLTKDPNGLDNAYSRYRYEFIWDWGFSEKTRFDGHLGYVEQRYQHNGRFNFTGVVAGGNIKWLYSEKTSFLLSGWREFSQAANVNTSFILKQGVSFTPIWAATPKIELRLPLSYEQQDFLGSDPKKTQKDDLWLAGLNLVYKPRDNIELDMLMQHEERSSTVQTRNYQSESVGLNLRVTF